MSFLNRGGISIFDKYIKLSKILFVIFIFSISYFFPHFSFAAHMIVTPNPAGINEGIGNIDCDQFVAFFDANTGVQVGYPQTCGQSLVNPLPIGSYIAVEYTWNWEPGSIDSLTLNDLRNDPQYDGPSGEEAFTIFDDTPSGGGGVPLPISVPSVVYNDYPITPVCGPDTYYFDVVDFAGPASCGSYISFGVANNINYEVRALDSNFNLIPPSAFVRAINNLGESPPENILNNLKFRNFSPIINLFSPLSGMVYSTDATISYKATDKNDLGTSDEKSSYGLGTNPVSIYYSDKSFDWSLNNFVSVSDKTLIKKDLPAEGEYKWPVKNLTPGVLYRIIANVIDKAGILGEAVSDFFSVDFTPPVFKVYTDPTLVRKGDVTITVESSENLSIIPDVIVTQRGGKQVTLKMTGATSSYTGIYTVIDGYDGNANIYVSGIDLAGNVGKEIVSGGSFSVGINPPPKPVISGLSKIVTYFSTTTLSGTVREDTKVILSVNGKEISSTTPDTKGNFAFNNISLDAVKNHGLNYLNVISKDVFDSVSESASIEVKYNKIPSVSITKPISKEVISGQYNLISYGSDGNQDILYYTYQIISLVDFNNKGNWTNIAENIPSSNFNYDTTEVEDGDYLIRSIADDGYITATSTPVQVNIKNILPFFRFEDGRSTISKESNVTINGKVLVPTNLSSSIKIVSIYYSMDGGNKWTEIKLNTRNLLSEQKFSVTLSNLKEGTYQMLWRVKDTRNFNGKGSHLIIIDKTAPYAPVIKSPKNNTIITDSDDENSKKDGTQVSISGVSEASSIITLSYNGKTIMTKSYPTGIFKFLDITLEKRGENKFDIFATDEAINIGATNTLTLVYNNPAVINFINPKPFGGLSGNAVLSWNITDADNDKIQNVTVSYRENGGVYKNLLTNANASGTYNLDTTKLLESNNYELKITASDGITPVVSTAIFSIDRTLPFITSFILDKKVSNNKISFSGSGTAGDSISGIQYVEYSIMSAKNNEKSSWYKGIITKGFMTKNVTFTIKYPGILEDENYTVYVRVVDVSGNLSEEKSKNISIDRTPPNVGSFFLIKDNLNFIPDQEGKLSFYINTQFIFAVSLENDASTSKLFIGNNSFDLSKNKISGLWEATTSVNETDIQKISISAEDKSGNRLEKKDIGSFYPLSEGSIDSIDNNGVKEPIALMRIRVLKLNDTIGQYEKYNPIIDGTPTIIETDNVGKYSLILPQGTYRLDMIKSGYKIIRQKIVLVASFVVSDNFTTKKIYGLEKIISDIWNGLFNN